VRIAASAAALREGAFDILGVNDMTRESQHRLASAIF
jgi:hypothetical protein